MDYEVAYKLAEQENSNLRAHLRWCLSVLPDSAKVELARRLQGPIEDGGVVRDAQEDDELLVADMHGLIGRLVAHLEKIFPPDGSPTKQPDDPWYAQAEALLTAAREYEEPKQPTLASVRALA